MDRILKPNLTQINNVSLGGKFSCELPIGPAYRYLDIIVTMTSAGGATLGAITDFLDQIVLYANGKPFRTFLATEASDIYALYGSAYKPIIGKTSGSGNALIGVLSGTALAAEASNSQATCRLRVYFEEPWRKSWAAASSRKFYTSFKPKPGTNTNQVLGSFTLEGIIPSTANNTSATSLSVLIYAATDASVGPIDASGNPILNTLKWQRYPGISYTAATDIQLQNVVKYNKGKDLCLLEQMSIFSQSTGDDVNRLQVNADGRVVYDAASFENFGELINHGFNPVWNLDETHYVADANDVIMDGLVLSTPGGAYVNNLVATATLSAAAGANKTLVVISQVYGPLD